MPTQRNRTPRAASTPAVNPTKSTASRVPTGLQRMQSIATGYQQALQNQQNAPYFQAYYAAHPELTPPPGTPGIPFGGKATAPQDTGWVAAHMSQGEPGFAISGAPSDFSTFGKAKATPDPRKDGLYTAAVSQLAGRIAAAKAQNALEQSRDDTDQTTLLGRLAAARDADLQTTNSNANREGLFFSTRLGQRRGEVEGDYKRRGDDADLAYNRRKDDRTANTNALGTLVEDPNSPLGYVGTGGAASELQALFEEAIRRQLAADQG